MITREQLEYLCGVMQEHPESVYMGKRFLDEINIGSSLPCEARAELWHQIMDAMIDGDVEKMFCLLTGREFLDVLQKCCIVPSDTNKEAYIPIMPWEMGDAQKQQPFDVMNALRFAEAARSTLAGNAKGAFECPLCGGEAKASIAENGHLHAHCGHCNIRIAE